MSCPVRSVLHLFVLSATLAGFAARPAPADQFVVPDDGALATVLGLAAAGDEIVVRAGTYVITGGPLLVDKSITIRSESGATDVVLDAHGASRVMLVSDFFSMQVELKGLAFRNGSVTTGLGGAGLLVETESFVVIENCHFQGNTTSTPLGAGALQAEPMAGILVRDTTFAGNAAIGGGLGPGAMKLSGLAFSRSLRNCRFEGNSTAGLGGAVLVQNADVFFWGCTFEQNQATGELTGFGGAAAIVNDADVRFRHCRFTDNSAFERGGAIVVDAGAARVDNTIIDGNTALRGAAIGVADELWLTSSTVTGNTSAVAGAAAIHGPTATALIRNSIVTGNGADPQVEVSTGSAVDFSIVPGLVGPTGYMVIEDDPAFVDPAAGDYRLAPNSPAIDRGATSLYEGLSIDHAGRPRTLDDPDVPDTGDTVYGPTIDLGALERQPDDPCRADVDGDGEVGFADLLEVLTEWGPCP